MATLVVGLWLGVALGGSLSERSDFTVESEDIALFDLEVDSLSAAPLGSVAELCLAFVSEGELAGWADQRD